jgi:shikimate dehydrogenase
VTFSRSKTNKSPLVFVLGHPLDHSLSPAMQNAALLYLGIPWTYLPLDIEKSQLGPVLKWMREFKLVGANITVPYKEDVLPFLDQVEPNAKWLGSVNTLYWKGSKLCGTSTDGEGFLRSLGRRRGKLKGSIGLLLGAGGAARAVAGALAQSGVKSLSIANRSNRRAILLRQKLKKGHPRLETSLLSLSEAERTLKRFDWVIQATSIGLKKGESSPLSLRMARKSTWVVDLIYHRETAFLKEARERGLPRLGGLGMLLHQGALSFSLWTGRKAPLRIMERALRAQLSKRRG